MMDKPDQSALGALRELGERAAARPWLDFALTLSATPEDINNPWVARFRGDNWARGKANIQYTTVAVNSIDTAVEALEDVTTELSKYVGYLPIPATRVVGARRVLAAIRKAAQEAM